MTRVLVVDDSRYIGTVVGNALTTAGYDVERAPDGESAVEAANTVDPDVVAIDVEMPGIGSIETVDRIMATNPTPIVMLGVPTDSGVDASMDALERGAMAVVEKPDGNGSGSLADLADELVETVDELATASTSALALARTSAAVHRSRSRSVAITSGATGNSGSTRVSTGQSAVSAPDGTTVAGPNGPAAESTTIRSETAVSVDVPPETDPTIVVGASTGGPRIVERMLRAIPDTLNARFVIVQHMPDDFTDRFAQRLDRTSDYTVREAEPVDRISAGEAVVAPGDTHLEVTAATDEFVDVEHSLAPHDHGVCPAIDVTMRSVASVRPDNFIGVVLSGMGNDGALGIEAIHDAGGRTVAQDEQSSPVFGIPKRAIATGAVDDVVSATSLPAHLVNAATGDAPPSGGEC